MTTEEKDYSNRMRLILNILKKRYILFLVELNEICCDTLILDLPYTDSQTHIMLTPSG